jgi:hypothetical protein
MRETDQYWVCGSLLTRQSERSTHLTHRVKERNDKTESDPKISNVQRVGTYSCIVGYNVLVLLATNGIIQLANYK